MTSTNRLSDKKGFLALEALIGTILSVIALVVLVGFFADLLPQEDNKKIAEENAQSIVDFVNYFQTDINYNTLDNCFNLLKLDFQTNFQFQKEGKENYFYLIAEDGVYLVPFSKFQFFYDDVDSSSIDLNNYIKVESFKYPIELYFDDTDKTNWNILSTIIFVNDELNIELKNLDTIHNSEYNSFYLLKPNIPNLGDKITSYLPFTSKESNNYEVYFPEDEIIGSDDLDILSEPKYIVYSNSNSFGKPIMFITNSKYVIPQIKNNLCSQKYFSKLQLESFYENPKNINKIDYNNNKIVFQELSSNDGNKFQFEWNNGPICKINTIENNCIDVLNLENIEYYSENNNLITYNDYVEKIKLFLQGENINPIENWGVDKIIPLTNKQIINSKVYFSDAFNSLDHNKYNINQLENPDYLNKNGFFDITQFNNDNINGCEDDLCNLLKYDNTNIYSYVGGVETSGIIWKTIENKNNLEYYSFNELFLRKNQVEFQKNEFSNTLYFNGKEINYDVFTPEQKGLSIPFYDDPEQEQLVYRFILNDIIKEENFVDIEIFLSSYQFNRIPQYQFIEVQK